MDQKNKCSICGRRYSQEWNMKIHEAKCAEKEYYQKNKKGKGKI